MSKPFAGQPLLFYGGVFSNFAASEFSLLCDITGNVETYATVEHYFQAHKATVAFDHDYINEADTAYEAKQRGREIALRHDWEEIKYGIMVKGLHEKFKIPMYRAKIINSAGRELREDSPTDFVWGWRNNGQNLLGKALMEVRAAILETL